MARDRLARRNVEMPFDHVTTSKQYRSDLDELSRIADEFAPAMSDERLASCECRGSYEPVCGNDDMTYPSPCFASCVGASLKHIGACVRGGVSGGVSDDDDGVGGLADVRDPVCSCSLKEKSVCGVDGNTYINRCFAQCANIQVRQDGPCYNI